MRRPSAAIVAAVLLLTLTGCGTDTPGPSTEPSDTPSSGSRVEVDWDAYPPSTQKIIDEEQAEGDCDALQGMFDVADRAGFVDQMKYLDEALGLAGCYG